MFLRCLGVGSSIARYCAHGACEVNSRFQWLGMSMHIVDDEQRRDRPQHPCALRVPAPRGHLRRWRSAAMYHDIACVAPPGICPRQERCKRDGARNAIPSNTRTDSQVSCPFPCFGENLHFTKQFGAAHLGLDHGIGKFADVQSSQETEQA
jgi:hypothetical protein